MSAPSFILAAVAAAAVQASAPAAILRSVTTAGAVAAGNNSSSGGNNGRASKNLHYFGSGNASRIRVVINNWSLAGLNNNTLSIQEMWLTILGQSTGFQVKFSGATTATVPAGAHRFVSDWIYPSDLPGAGSAFTRGAGLYIGSRIEVPSGGSVPTTLDRNPTSNSSIGYTPGSATINNLAGSAAMTWSGTVASIGDQGIALIIEGEFVDGDKPVFSGIGDSITAGSNEADRTGWYYRMLFDDFANKTNPRAGLHIALVGSNASLWQTPAIAANLADITKLANVHLERYGINSLTSNGGQALADTIITDRRYIWSAIRTNAVTTSGARAPIVAAVEMTPRTSGTFTTLAGQTPTAGCGKGQSLDLLHSSLLAIAGQPNGPDQYIDFAQDVRGATDRALDDYFKWGVTPSAMTDDGLHPITASHALMGARAATWAAAVV